jgi:GLPGLI family protein
MKLVLVILSALLLVTKAVHAQTPDTAKISVQYHFTHVRDTLNKDKPYTETMVLLVGANASVYKSLDRKMRLAQMQGDLVKQIQQSPGGPQNFNVKMSGSAGTSTEYYYFLNEHKAYRKEDLMNTYLIEESAISPQWKISSDTSTIGGYHCQKATTHFKGRDYEAWFCPDLPFHAGPWKLNGLPGLIIEAADHKNEVVFKFDGITQVIAGMLAPPVAPSTMASGTPGVTVRTMVRGIDYKHSEYVIMLPEKGIKSTEQELSRLKEMRDKNPEAFMRAGMASMGLPAGADNALPTIKIQAVPATSKPVINNPIELK